MLNWRNSSVCNVSDLVTHHWAAHHCVDGSNPNSCERSLASHVVYTLIQCTPLLVEKAGVAPVVTFRITACKQEKVQVRYPLWIWNPWRRTHEVQNRSNQWLHKKKNIAKLMLSTYKQRHNLFQYSRSVRVTPSCSWREPFRVSDLRAPACLVSTFFFTWNVTQGITYKGC